MADPVQLRRAFFKVFWLVVVAGVGHWALWPDVPVRDWLGDNSDWKMKFAFVAWVAVTLGMAYDALLALGRGIVATPDSPRRR
jgi:hypothetical protein